MWNARKYSRKSLVIIDESVMIDTLKVCYSCKYLKRLDGLHTRMSYFSCTVHATGGLIRRDTVFHHNSILGIYPDLVFLAYRNAILYYRVKT